MRWSLAICSDEGVFCCPFAFCLLLLVTQRGVEWLASTHVRMLTYPARCRMVSMHSRSHANIQYHLPRSVTGSAARGRRVRCVTPSTRSFLAGSRWMQATPLVHGRSSPTNFGVFQRVDPLVSVAYSLFPRVAANHDRSIVGRKLMMGLVVTTNG